MLHCFDFHFFLGGIISLQKGLSYCTKHLHFFFCFRTAKTLRNKGGTTDYTKGVSREQRAINRRNKLESSLVSSGINYPKSCSDKRAWKRMKKEMFECE